MVELDKEAKELAMKYIQEDAIARKHIIDAQHIAMATIHHVDFLASWNLKRWLMYIKSDNTMQ